MQRNIDAALELAQVEGADSTEQEELGKALIDISSDNPRTGLGVARIRKIAGKYTQPIHDAIYKVAIDIAAETAKKMLTGGK